MPLADTIGQVYQARFQVEYRQDNVWMAVADDQSAQLGMGSDRIQIPTDAEGEELSERTRANVLSGTASDHEWGAPDVVNGDVVTVQLNQFYDIDMLVPTHIQAQSRPNWIAKKSMDAARLFREQVSNDIRAEFNNAPAASRLADISFTSAEWTAGGSDVQDALLSKLAEAELSLDAARMPKPGRYCIVGPYDYNLMVSRLIELKLYLVQGANDTAAIDGMIPRYRGFNIQMDNSLGIGTAATDDLNHYMYFGRRGEGITYAGQVRKLRAFESEQYKGTRVQGEMSYATKVNQPTRVRLARSVIT